jgi:hypothetical protein
LCAGGDGVGHDVHRVTEGDEIERADISTQDVRLASRVSTTCLAAGGLESCAERVERGSRRT